MSFSFGFSGDDIEEDPNDVVEQSQQEQGQNSDENGPPPIAARTHDLNELVGMHTMSSHTKSYPS
jgi:protein-histidine N-methyltransferase